MPFLHYDPIYGGFNLTGRSTAVVGIKMVGNQDRNPASGEIRKGSDLVVKLFWPEETWVGGASFIGTTGKIGIANDLEENHIPAMLGNTNPPHLMCSTSLEVRLCKHPRCPRFVPRHSIGAGQSTLCPNTGIEGDDMNKGDLLYDPVAKLDVLNNFGLARMGGQEGALRGRDGTGTTPFVALDLLGSRAVEDTAPRPYRHGAEPFAWCLVCICICMEKGGNGQIRFKHPRPLTSWFMESADCFRSKMEEKTGILTEVTLHERCKYFAAAIRVYWIGRCNRQLAADNPAKELTNHESFKTVFQLLLNSSRVHFPVPNSKKEHFLEIIGLVKDR